MLATYRIATAQVGPFIYHLSTDDLLWRMIRVWRRCGFMSNNFDHLLFTTLSHYAAMTVECIEFEELSLTVIAGGRLHFDPCNLTVIRHDVRRQFPAYLAPFVTRLYIAAFLQCLSILFSYFCYIY